MVRFLALILCVWISLTPLWAETLVAKAKIADVSERGFTLTLGTEPMAVADGPETRFWSRCTIGERKAFQAGQTVHVRVKTDFEPAILREIADEASGEWLAKVRNNFVKGRVSKVDPKRVVLTFDDGTAFDYRATDKTQVKIAGREGSTTFDLQAGQTVWAKGRLLATGDTWLAEVTDEKPTEPEKPTKSTSGAKPTKPAAPAKAPKVDPVPDSGVLKGNVLSHLFTLSMFDMLAGVRPLHITYNSRTKFYVDGRAAKAKDIQRDLRCVVEYKRDRTGRIVASKVELFSPGREPFAQNRDSRADVERDTGSFFRECSRPGTFLAFRPYRS